MSTPALEIRIKSIPRDPRNTLVISCPEPSLASVVAIEYVVNALGMEEMGYLRLRNVTPVVTVIDGVAKLPHRLFYDRSHYLITVRQHVPIPPMLYRQFINKVLDWAEENGISRVVCLTAIPTMGDRETDKVYFVTEENNIDEYKAMGFEPIKEATITGAEAIFLESVLSRNINGALLLAESKVLTTIKRLVDSGRISTHRDVMAILGQTVGQFGPDVSAALKLVRAVGRIIGVEINVDKLVEHANRYAFLIEKNLEEYLKPPREEMPIVY